MGEKVEADEDVDEGADAGVAVEEAAAMDAEDAAAALWPVRGGGGKDDAVVPSVPLLDCIAGVVRALALLFAVTDGASTRQDAGMASGGSVEAAVVPADAVLLCDGVTGTAVERPLPLCDCGCDCDWSCAWVFPAMSVQLFTRDMCLDALP